MKNTDLRIGNLVLNDRCECSVVGILSDNINIVNLKTKQRNIINSDIQSIKPIPLTEDLLNKIDFFNIDYGYSRNIELEKVLRLIVSDGWLYPQIEQSPEMSNEETQIVSLNRIKYLHELQNLWKVLKDEELEIK